MTYQEQIKNPKWQKKRLEILKRDGFECKICIEKEVTLHVHHLVYHKNCKIWEYDNKYLITLCEDCHEEWHNDKFYIDEYIALSPPENSFAIKCLISSIVKIKESDIMKIAESINT